MQKLFIVYWRSATGRVWQSERYATTPRAAFKQVAKTLADLRSAGRALCVKGHTGEGYTNRGRFI